MATTFVGNRESNVPDGFGSVTHKYTYPEKMKLKPGAKDHDFILNQVLTRAQEAFSQVSQRFDAWEDVDRSLCAYVAPETLKDEDNAGDKTNSIVIPTSYANMETVLTYMTKAFLGDNIFRYLPVGPEDDIGAKLMELLVQRQMMQSHAGLRLHTQWRDSFAYGFGVVAPVWTEHYAVRNRTEDQGFLSLVSGLWRSTGTQDTSERTLIREGNELINIRPYRTLADPNVSIEDIQKGEFFGWSDNDNFTNLTGRDQVNGGDLFNVKYLDQLGGGQSAFSVYHDEDSKSFSSSRSPVGTITRPFDIIYMYINIIPEEWGLGKETNPEKWMFGVAGDSVVIKAEPAGLDHGLYPVGACAPDSDGYSSSPISRMELINPMQKVVDFVINSHIANVRKAVNDMLIVDPMLVNVDDLNNPEPGKIIRLRKRGWGRGVSDVVKQLNISDITKGNINDAAFLMNMIQETTGGADILKGVIQGGERTSATEASTANKNALSRLEKTAQIISMQSMQQVGYIVAKQTQQLMTQDTFVRLAGRYRDDLAATYGAEEFAQITPNDINIDLDVEVSDGSMPGGESPEAWVQLMQMVNQDPILKQGIDSVKVFKHIARNLGAKNVEQFTVKKAAVQSDEDVARQVELGNLVEEGTKV